MSLSVSVAWQLHGHAGFVNGDDVLVHWSPLISGLIVAL